MDSTTQLSPLKRAYLALQKAEARIAELEGKLQEPIAIVGLSCRFPGSANDPEAYWSLLENKRNAISTGMVERWRRLGAPTVANDLPEPSQWAGIIDDTEHFDPQFFGISPREALGMDPQQRLLLEGAWEALEHAAIAPSSLYGKSAGVYFALCSSDYQQIAMGTSQLGAIDPHFASGVAHSIASGRLAYILGLMGPAITIDTACSSSLTAVHLACQGLRTGDCKVAIAGGANLVLSPEGAVMYYHSGMLASDGQCKAFDKRADGFVRGEGCGVIILKRLKDAQADRNRILGIIRGSVINQDGPSSGLTVPNGGAQRQLVRQALAYAGIKPSQVGYVEAHGTGTSLGDPIEVQALAAVLGENRDPNRPLLIGSVKTNIGHLEAAAGIAGLIKVLLAFQNKQIPAQRHAEDLNPLIPWSELPVQVVREQTPWEPIDGRRIAGVSSFGFSGTNAHVIVEEAPAPVAVSPGERTRHVLALSARSAEALKELAKRYAVHFRRHPQERFADICHTANIGRSHFSHRLAISAESLAEGGQALEAFGASTAAPEIAQGIAAVGSRPKIAFLFTGQGAQFAGMGQQLYRTCKAYRDAMDQCEKILADSLDVPLGQVIRGEHPRSAELLDQTLYTQPGLFALEYSLVMAWKSWGVEPGLVAGHSLGEYVALVIAGVMDLESALRLVARRARLMHDIREDGAMIAVEAPEEELRAAIAGHEDRVTIAAINGPVQGVLTGYRDAVELVASQLAGKGRRCKPLRVSQAFHSPILDRITKEFERAASEVKFAAPRIRVLSNLTGSALDSVNANYLARQMREPVLFRKQIETLQQMGYNIVVEIGPRPVLIGLAQGCLEDSSWGSWIPSLQPRIDDSQSLSKAIQQLYCTGVDPDWSGWDRDEDLRFLALPTYPFERRRYWTPHNAVNKKPGNTGISAGHPLLGVRLQSPLDSTQFEASLSASQAGLEWISGHRLAGRVVLPATAFMEAMLMGGRSAHGPEWNELHDIVLFSPLQFEAEAGRKIQVVVDPVVVDPVKDAAAHVRFYSDAPDGWTLNAEALLKRRQEAEPDPVPRDQVLTRCPTQTTGPLFYDTMRANGADFGPNFQRLNSIWHTPGEGIASIRIDAPDSSWAIHPAALDAGLQAGAGVICGSDRMCMPLSVKRYSYFASPGAGAVYAHLITTPAGDAGFNVTLHLADENGARLATIEDLRLQKLQQKTVSDAEIRNWFYSVDWKKSPLTPQIEIGDSATILIAGREDAVTDRVEAALLDQGRAVVRVAPPDAQSASGLAGALEALGNSAVKVLYFIPPPKTAEIGLTSQRPRFEELSEILRALTKPSDRRTKFYCISRGVSPVDAGTPANTALSLTQVPVLGAVSAAGLEHPELACTRLDVDPGDPEAAAEAIISERLGESKDDCMAWRGRVRYLPRLRRIKEEIAERFATVANPLRLIPRPGGLEGLKWEPIVRGPLAPDEVEIRVHAAAINFHDVLTALGVLTDPDPLGAECAGTVSRVGSDVRNFAPGDKVVSLAGGCFGTFATAPESLTIPLPGTLSFSAAAAQPMVYLTADFCLNEVAKMKAGERVLIHAATGGVGLAAISLCKKAGVEIFATAGSEEKRAHLRSLGIQHVMDSRSPEFARQIKLATGGQGVDIVLNSLAGELIDAGLSCLNRHGRFVEIGKTDLRNPADIARQYAGVTYTTIYLTDEIYRAPVAMMDRLRAIMAGITSGALTELPREEFPLDQAVDAFRRMAMARHKGKIVLKCGEDEPAPVHPDGSYIVTGGLTGVGLEVGRWLSARGARQIVLAGRRPPTPETESILAELRANGTSVVIVNRDVADPAGASEILASAGDQLRGVIHCAGVYDDAPLLSLTWDRFEKVLAPKAAGAWNLHSLTLGRNLDFFVCFSSWASLGGSPAQANYCAANAYLDALSHYRRSLGLPSLTINWGAWGRTGFATSEIVRKRLASFGLQQMEPEDALRGFDLALSRSLGPQIAIGPILWRRLLDPQSQRVLPGLYADFAAEASGPGTGNDSGKNLSLSARLDALPPARRSRELLLALTELAARVLGLPPASLNPEQPLKEFGMDSLIAVELRNSLCTVLGKQVPPTLLFDHPTVSSLAGYLEPSLCGSQQKSTSAAPLPPVNASSVLDRIEKMSDEEVDRLFETADKESEALDASRGRR